MVSILGIENLTFQVSFLWMLAWDPAPKTCLLRGSRLDLRTLWLAWPWPCEYLAPNGALFSCKVWIFVRLRGFLGFGVLFSHYFLLCFCNVEFFHIFLWTFFLCLFLFSVSNVVSLQQVRCHVSIFYFSRPSHFSYFPFFIWVFFLKKLLCYLLLLHIVLFSVHITNFKVSLLSLSCFFELIITMVLFMSFIIGWKNKFDFQHHEFHRMLVFLSLIFQVPSSISFLFFILLLMQKLLKQDQGKLYFPFFNYFLFFHHCGCQGFLQQ